MVLDAADTETKLWDVVQRNGFSVSDACLAHSGNDGDCVFTWVHSRKTNGKLLISSQTLVSANTKLAEYQGELAYNLSRSSYGMSEDVPFTEASPLGTCTNPYGWTKWMIEQILRDYAVAHPDMRICLLRYFNPVGAHESGLIGEDPKGIPNNLFPYISKVAGGTLECLTVFGDDYDTPDGTCLRDYIHVCDLADGHVKAIEYLAKAEEPVSVFNLGTGKGTSVKEAVAAFEKACGHPINHVFGARRPGDIAVCYASTEKAEKVLGFKAKYGIDEMCSSCWKWQTMNPEGLKD